MIYTRKKRQKNRRLLRQLGRTADDFNIGKTGIYYKNTGEVKKEMKLLILII